MSKSYGRQYEALDITKLFAEWDHSKWNQFLTKCFVEQDIEKLRKTRYQLQAGMTDAASKGLVTNKLAAIFARWQESIRRTAVKIAKHRASSPLDDPAFVINGPKKFGREWPAVKKKMLDEKRKRDAEFERILVEWSF